MSFRHFWPKIVADLDAPAAIASTTMKIYLEIIKSSLAQLLSKHRDWIHSASRFAWTVNCRSQVLTLLLPSYGVRANIYSKEEVTAGNSSSRPIDY